jgi:hypothetical protein
MATILGTAINFGFPTTTDGITITNVVGVLQSAEITEDGDMEEVRDADGDLASEVHYNRNQKATLEIVITGTNLAGAITNSALATNLAKGMFLPITACAGLPELISNTWRIMDSKVAKGNTSAARLTVSLRKDGGITTTAS